MRRNFFLLFLLFLISCNSSRQFHEVSTSAMTLQVFHMPEETGDNGALTFRVRIIPSALLMTSMRNGLQNKMWYDADSSFFMQSGKELVRASMVQPVADGVNGSFQYLVMFDNPNGAAADKLLFHDRYMTKTTYTVNIND